MSETTKTQPGQDAIQATVEHASKAAEETVAMGREVVALWLGVTRNAVEAAAGSLRVTSELIAGLADSVSELSDRVEGGNEQR